MSEEADGSFNRPYVMFVKYIVIWYILIKLLLH